jgi:hypothetical protein
VNSVVTYICIIYFLVYFVIVVPYGAYKYKKTKDKDYLNYIVVGIFFFLIFTFWMIGPILNYI